MSKHIHIPQTLWTELSKVAAFNKIPITKVIEALQNQFYSIKK